MTDSVAVGLPQLKRGAAAWGDFDNDGRLDFLIAGLQGVERVSQLWRNTGNGFTNVPVAGLEQVVSGTVAWGDYDNDGRLDFLVTGYTTNGLTSSQIWRNTGTGFTNALFGGASQLSGSTAAWGDYDNDGRLDFLLMGMTNSPALRLWHNTAPVTNTPPTAPAGLTASGAASVLTLSWLAASDAQTPTNGLSYNVRVGTTPGGADLFAGHVNPTNGFRRVPAIGNAGSRLNLTLNGLPINLPLYWGVQAVDTAFAGGPFATNVVFLPSVSAVTPPTGPTVGGITLTLQGNNFGTNGTVTIGGNNAPVLPGNWTNTQIQCTLPAGQGTNVPVIVTSGGLASVAANFTYNLPGITNVNPSIGPTAGGITITLRGTNFGTSGTVSIGGKPASVVTTNWSHTQIQCVLPPGQGLNQSVVVVAGDQPSPPASFNYAGPIITNVFPALVPTAGSNTMTLWGTNFGSSGFLFVNGQFVSVAATNWSDSEIKFLSPAGQGTNIPIFVVTAGQSSPTMFYNYAPPGITNISPAAGPMEGGLTISLKGTNFGSSGTVRIGTNTILPVVSAWSHSQIDFTLPPGQGTNVPVFVSVGGQTSLPVSFNYFVPGITSISPVTGPTAGNITITLTGTNFGTSGNLSLGGNFVPVVATNWSQTQIKFTLPMGQGTNLPVIVTTSGQASAPAHFSYAAPSITSVNPPQGPEIGGITITLTGTDFGSSGTVTMGTNGNPVVTSGWSDSQIQFTLPAGQGTNVPIIVTSGGQSSLPSNFIYFRPAITNVSPATGPTVGGITITLKGQHFGTNGTVTFAGNNVATTTNWSDTQLQFTLPAGQGTNVPIVVISGGQAAPASFSYFVPGITGMSPTTGPTAGGTTITLTGTNFGTSGAVMVDQSMVFVVATNWSDTQIRFTLPAGQGTNIPISVMTGGQMSAPVNFSYYVPGITNVSPPTGPTAGGTTITLTGTNFGTSGLMRLNGNLVPVTGTNWSDSQIRFTLPQGQGTNVPIVVLTAGQSSSAAYFNYAAPVITSINPTSAPTAGGALLTIMGTNFGTSGTVKVGNKPATTVFPGSEWSHNQIICLIPGGGGESLPIVVTTEGQASNPFYFSYLRPTLTIKRVGSNVVLAWPTNAPDYWPEESTSLSGAPWSFISQGRSINGVEYNSVLPAASTNMFFRLRVF